MRADIASSACFMWAEYAAIYGTFVWCPFALWLTLRLVCRRLYAMFGRVAAGFRRYIRRRLSAAVGPVVAALSLRFMITGDYVTDLMMGFDINATIYIVCEHDQMYYTDVAMDAHTLEGGTGRPDRRVCTPSFERLWTALTLHGVTYRYDHHTPAAVTGPKSIPFTPGHNPFIGGLYRWTRWRRAIVVVALLRGVSAYYFIERLQGRVRAGFNSWQLFTVG